MSEIRVDNITDEAGTGKPGFPNGITATGAALTDPEITGGIYLGGTGSANHLEDYEEGTWTPVFDTMTGFNYTNQFGSYTKIGNIVNFNIFLTWSSSNPDGSRLKVLLPFTTAPSSKASIGACSYTSNNLIKPSSAYELSVQLGNNDNTLEVYGQVSSGNKVGLSESNVNSSGELVISGHFMTE